MIGAIIVGSLAALGIARIARRHYRWHHAWHHGGWGHHGLHGWHHGPGRCGGWVGRHDEMGGAGPWGPGPGDRDEGPGVWMGGPGFNPLHFRRGRRWLLRGLFRRLETTPTQQHALMAATEEFQESAKAFKGEAKRTRSDIAAALRRPSIDAESMGELFARHDSALDGLRKAFVGMTIKVHETLDDDQRERLARLVEAGPRGLRHELGDEMNHGMSGGW